MGRTAILLSAVLLVGALLSVSCGKGSLPGRDDALVEITFSVRMEGEGTRTTEVPASEEKKIVRWALLLYRDGMLVDCGTITPAGSIRRSLEKGVYQAYAIVNYPAAEFRPQNMLTTARLVGEISRLEDNADFQFVMAGMREIVVDGSGNVEQTLPVKRLVCKTGIRKISISEQAPAACRNAFVLKGIYLTNCIRTMPYLSDTASGDLPAALSAWYHPMGYAPEQEADALLADNGIGQGITPDRPYTVPRYFYCYPNATPEEADTRSPDWSVRCTRMVIEAEVAGRTCYYPVTLPGMMRNRTYIADEAIIRSMGSGDPEALVPGSLEVLFSTEDADWSPEYVIVETL